MKTLMKFVLNFQRIVACKVQVSGANPCCYYLSQADTSRSKHLSSYAKEKFVYERKSRDKFLYKGTETVLGDKFDKANISEMLKTCF